MPLSRLLPVWGLLLWLAAGSALAARPAAPARPLRLLAAVARPAMVAAATEMCEDDDAFARGAFFASDRMDRGDGDGGSAGALGADLDDDGVPLHLELVTAPSDDGGFFLPLPHVAPPIRSAAGVFRPPRSI